MSQAYAVRIYFIILTTLVALCFLQRRYLKSADKRLAYLFCLTLLTETCADFAITWYRNNTFVYQVWSPIELLLICCYFNEAIPAFKKYNIGIIIGIAGFIAAILNVILFQPINTHNSFFLLFEGFAIISMCLISFYYLVLKDAEIVHNPHFWFTTIFLFYWSSVFVYWGIYNFLLTSMKEYMKAATYMLWSINYLSYVSFSIVFVRYRKISQVNG